MYKPGSANAAVDAIGSVLNFMSSGSPAAAVARSQCASFKNAVGNSSYSGAAGVNDMAAALGLSSAELAQEVANAALIGNAGDVSGDALKSWASALDARLTPLVYLVDNKLSAADIAVAVQIKLRLFPSGAADKSLAAIISPSHVRFFNNIYAIVGRNSGSPLFSSEVKHPGGVKATPPVWPDVSVSASSTVLKVEQPKQAAAAAPAAEKKEKPVVNSAPGADAPPAGEKKEKPAKAEKPKEPEAPKSKGNDASALDIRVGVVCTCVNHPEADKLYVLTVDTGDAQPRTVLSGLRGVVEPAHLSNRRCVIVCNLPTRDMKGVVSTGLMLVATSAEGAKIPLTPPETSPIGTRVTLPNFPGDVAPAGTNLKKLWERIGDKFSTDASCAALLEAGGILTTPQGAVTAPGAPNAKVA